MPVDDWQFWVVSVLAVLALAYLLREVLPERWSPFKRKKKGKATTLTVKGKSRE